MKSGYATIAEIQKANELLGYDWFSDAAVKRAGKKVESDVISGFYFIESNDRATGDPGRGRIFRAVQASPEGEVFHHSTEFGTADEARDYINGVLAGR